MTADYRFGRFELRPARRQLLDEGQPVALGGRAFDVLLTLVEHRERLVTKDELLELAWPGLIVEENNLQVQISSLRKVLGDGFIETVPGRGYRFSAEVTRTATVLPDAPRHNLPYSLTRFIGHEADLVSYEKVVAANRLVTLTGAGGCGKTRHAVELASRRLPMLTHGAWFVDLAPMADAERLPLTVARSLNLMERPGHPIVDVVCDHLEDRQMLLVMDNCEHVLSGCAELVATLIRRASRLSILATSREPLGLPGEQTIRVRSLSCPPADQRSFAALETFEAVQLFMDRARLVRPDLSLDQASGVAVAEICRRLDGIPLAIELAAARTKVRSIAELLSMMDDRFRLLVGGSAAAPPRQQTLLAMIKWSFDLLEPHERQLMERLSIFSGGWTLEAAMSVTGERAEQYEMLESLTHLLDKSLITIDCREGTRTRYTMLDTVRRYGLEAIEAAGTRMAIAGRHLQYFVDLAERLEPATTGEEIWALHQLAPELENLLQALRDADCAPDGVELGLRLIAALDQYWLSLGLLELGYRVTTATLSNRGGEALSGARARALFVAARLAFFLGRKVESQQWANECLALARLLHDGRTTAGALVLVGHAFIEAGDVQQALALYHESLQLARELDDSQQIIRALSGLGTAHEYWRNLDDAMGLYLEALRRSRDCGEPRWIAISSVNVAGVYIALGQPALAWPLVLAAVDASSKTNSRFTMQWVLDTVSALATAERDWHWSARLLGAVDAARKLTGHQREFPAEFEASVVTVVRNALSKADFTAAYDAGRTLTVRQAIDEAREWLKTSAPPAGGVAVI